MANIIVVFPKLDDAKVIRNLLVRSGFTVAAACTCGAQAVSMADHLSGGIIVTGYKLTDMIYSEIVEYRPKNFDVLLVASKERLSACNTQELEVLPLPLKPYDLVTVLHTMLENQVTRRRQAKKTPPRRSKEEQDVIDRAKGILIEKEHMTEPEAYRYIQKRSMESGNRFIESAHMIISMYGDKE